MFRLLLLLLVLAPAAMAQQVSPSSAGKVIPLYATGAVAGNGADTTEDICQTYTMPANTMVNAGDKLHIFASGSFAASTDNKFARVRVNGVAGLLMGAPNGAAVGGTKWSLDAWFLKVDSGTTVTWASLGGVISGTANGTTSSTSSLALTNNVDIVVTAQDQTAGTQNAVTCQYFSVDLVKAPGT